LEPDKVEVKGDDEVEISKGKANRNLQALFLLLEFNLKEPFNL
jgi:hypothetical protein